uniref:MazG nucleotide pyrophosphohydrolase domain-containing protein n=1 Tax=Methylogaea oryzae TaxID=1295382 RepID=UPI000B1849E4
PEAEPVFAKVHEELDELREAHAEGDQAHIEEEVGDLLFVVVNLARHLGVSPEAALRAANAKFSRRFQHIEQCLAEQGKALEGTPLEELDACGTRPRRGSVLSPAPTVSFQREGARIRREQSY